MMKIRRPIISEGEGDDATPSNKRAAGSNTGSALWDKANDTVFKLFISALKDDPKYSNNLKLVADINSKLEKMKNICCTIRNDDYAEMFGLDEDGSGIIPEKLSALPRNVVSAIKYDPTIVSLLSQSGYNLKSYVNKAIPTSRMLTEVDNAPLEKLFSSIDAYRMFLTLIDGLRHFSTSANNIHIGKSEIPFCLAVDGANMASSTNENGEKGDLLINGTPVELKDVSTYSSAKTGPTKASRAFLGKPDDKINSAIQVMFDTGTTKQGNARALISSDSLKYKPGVFQVDGTNDYPILDPQDMLYLLFAKALNAQGRRVASGFVFITDLVNHVYRCFEGKTLETLSRFASDIRIEVKGSGVQISGLTHSNLSSVKNDINQLRKLFPKIEYASYGGGRFSLLPWYGVAPTPSSDSAKDSDDLFAYARKKNGLDKASTVSKAQLKKLLTEAIQLENYLGKKSVNEGGNMFKDADGNPLTTRIDQENVADTVKDIQKRLLPALGIPVEDTSLLGSVGKKLPGGTSGDIDLAIDAVKNPVAADFDAWTALVERACKKLDVEYRVMTGLSELSIRWPITSADGKQEGEYVQLDLMPTESMEFAQWSSYAPPEVKDQTYIKGCIRNLILESAAHVCEYKVLETGLVKTKNGIEELPVKVARYSFYTGSGLSYKVEHRKIAANKKLAEQGIHVSSWTTDDGEKKFVSNKPDTIAKIVFGDKVKGSDLLDWESTWEAAKKADWAKERWQAFLGDLRGKIMGKIKQGMTIPDPILDELGIALPKTEATSLLVEGEDDSAVDSHRRSLTKIYQLSGTKLRVFLTDLANGLSDAVLKIPTTPKIDGNAFRIGWYDGGVYVENSGSGLVAADGGEIDTFQKPAQRVARYLADASSKGRIFSKIDSLGLTGVKVTGELLVSGSELVDPDGTITYVGTTYDATKLGKYGSVVLFQAEELAKDTLRPMSKETQQDFIEFLCSEISDSRFSFFNLQKFAQDIEVSAHDFPKEVIQALRTSNPMKMGKQQAEELRDKINQALTKVYRSKFTNPDLMPKSNSELEGVVLELNGVMYGISYQEWKDKKRDYTSDIESIRNFPHDFLVAVTGMPATSRFLAMLNAIRSNPDAYQAQYQKVLPEFMQKMDEIITILNTREDLPRFIANLAKERGKALLTQFADGALTDDVMSLVELLDGKQVDKGGRTVVLIPGSFRPPHRGHLNMVKQYARMADEVVIGISSQTNVSFQRPDKYGRILSSESVKKIFEIYLDAAGLTNVSIDVTPRPMQWVGYRIHHLKNAKVILGVSSKDGADRFHIFREPKFTDTCPTVEVLPVDDSMIPSTASADGGVISATYIRDNIDNRKALRKVLPSELSEAQFERVYALLNPTKNGGGDDLGESSKRHNHSHRLYSEGGHAFDFVSRINQENVQATLDDIYERLLPLFHIKKDAVAPLGSTGKKLPGSTSGDIDLVFDKETLMKANHLETADEFVDLCEEIARKLGVETSIARKYGFGAVSYAWPIANADGKQKGQFVQLDFVVPDNFQFAQWGMHSPQEKEGEENPKSAIRNILLLAVARGGHSKVLKTGFVSGEGEDAPVEMERLMYDYKTGLYNTHRERPVKRDGTYSKAWKLKKEFLTDDPQRIANILFGRGVATPDDLLTTKGTWEALKRSKLWQNKETRASIHKYFQDGLSQGSSQFEAPRFVTWESSNVYMIDEGGNSFDFVSRINQENVKATLDDLYARLLPLLHVKPQDTATLGSTGKKLTGGTSGDIDLAMPQDLVLERNHIDSEEEWFSFIDKIAEKLHVEVFFKYSKGYNGVSMAWPIANSDGKQEGAFVQVDLCVVEDMELSKWSCYHPQEVEGEETPKTAVRNALLRTVANAGNWTPTETAEIDGIEVPVAWKHLTFSHTKGLFESFYERPPKKRGEGYVKTPKLVDRKLITSKVDRIASILFGIGVKGEDCLTAKQVWDLVRKLPAFRDPEKREWMAKVFREDVARVHDAVVPAWMDFGTDGSKAPYYIRFE